MTEHTDPSPSIWELSTSNGFWYAEGMSADYGWFCFEETSLEAARAELETLGFSDDEINAALTTNKG